MIFSFAVQFSDQVFVALNLTFGALVSACQTVLRCSSSNFHFGNALWKCRGLLFFPRLVGGGSMIAHHNVSIRANDEA